MGTEKEIGAWFKQTRELRGLTVSDATRRADLEPDVVVRIENGAEDSLSKLSALSHAIGGRMMFVPGELAVTMRSLMKEFVDPPPPRALSVVELLIQPEEDELDDEDIQAARHRDYGP